MLLPHEMGEDLCLGLARALYEPASHGRCDVGLAQLAEGDYPTPEALAALASSSPQSASAPLIRALDRVGVDEPGPRARDMLEPAGSGWLQRCATISMTGCDKTPN